MASTSANDTNEKHFQDTQDKLQQPEEQDPVEPEQTLSRQEWHKLCPTSQPLISMMTPANAFALAEALKEKRQDKTGKCQLSSKTYTYGRNIIENLTNRGCKIS